MKKSQERRSPVLHALLIMALALNSAMSFTLLVNRSKPATPPVMAAAQPLPATDREESNELATADKKAEAISEVLSRAETAARKPAKRAQAARVARVNAPDEARPGSQTARVQEERVILLPKTVPYRATKSTTLVTKEGGQRIFLPNGTKVHVAGLTQSGKALVVSKQGNPDGFVPGWAIEEIKEEEGNPPLSLGSPRGYGNPGSLRNEHLFSSLPTPRVSAGPYGGSIGIGPAYIYVGRNGQVSGSFSR